MSHSILSDKQFATVANVARPDPMHFLAAERGFSKVGAVQTNLQRAQDAQKPKKPTPRGGRPTTLDAAPAANGVYKVTSL